MKIIILAGGLGTRLSEYTKKSHSKLTSNDELNALNDVGKLNTYILSIEEKVWDLEKSYKLKEWIEQIYNETTSYDQGYSYAREQLLINAKILSESIYTKYDKLLNPEPTTN